VIEALEDNLVDLRNPLRVRHSPATRAEEADPDKRCHQSVPPDRSISTLVNEAGYTVARSASVVTELITRLILNRHLLRSALKVLCQNTFTSHQVLASDYLNISSGLLLQ